MAQVESYDPETHNYFRQNWSAMQDSSGILFFGNSTGLLSFDGEKWHPVKHAPKGSAVLMFAEHQNNIYWGGNGDLGIIKSDSLNQFTPLSHRSRIDSAYQNFSYLWQMIEVDGEIYHRNSNGIYVSRGDTIEVLFPEEQFMGIFEFEDQVLVQKENGELYYLEGDHLRPLPDHNFFNDDAIYDVISTQIGHLFFSRKKGIVRFNGEAFEPIETESSEYIIANRVFRAAQINETEIAVTTLDGGVVVINQQRELVQIFREEDGLPTNMVYNVYLDREETLWATTGNGIAKVLVNNPLKVWDESRGLTGIPLFITSFNEQTAVGTTEGLLTFGEYGNLIQNESINGRVYDGFILDDTFILTTGSGVYSHTAGEALKLSESSYRTFITDSWQSDLILGVSERKIDKLNVNNNSISSEPFLEINSEIIHAVKDRQRLWILAADNTVHLFNLDGIQLSSYRVSISEESRLNRIGRIAGKIRMGTDEGLFLYDESSDEFVSDSTFNDPEIQNEEVFRFRQCSENDVWFRNHRKIKRAVRESGNWRTLTNPYRTIARGLDEGVETIFCNDNGSVWFGSSTKLYQLSDPGWTYEHDFNTNITGVLVRNDSLVYGGYGDPSEIKELRFGENELRFTYAAASYIEPEANQYRTRLRGYEEEWSNWSAEPQKDYTFIPEGTYTFEVQGRNVYHKTGSIDSYTFTVLPPWYRTIWAYLVYLCLTGGVVYAGHKIRLKSILKEQRIRDGIARDLHDELSSTLSSISFFANAMDSPKTETQKENRYLSLIKKSSLEAKEKISDIVWVIHTENDDWDNLLMRCKRFASDILDARNIHHSFDIRGSFTGKPSITQKKNIWLIFREILTNIARHAEPDQVHIRFNMNAGQLHIHIEDNGKGFDPENTREDGYGVQNIKERAQQLKAKCTLESMPGEGTRWRIDLPVG
ncbi:MAG: triple tyrosine motif-containing protein [Balneolaceae bacterium]|nr:triple tyrosine motif-containing protein [Balneolaceae bacterium]